MEGQDLQDTVLQNLRSVTQSVKGGVPLSRLNRDYKDLLGASIPFRELGYSSLEDFIKSIPHVIQLSQINGQIMAEGVADTTTAHIVSLVSRQKQTRRVGRPLRKSYFSHRRGGFPSRYRGGSATVSRGSSTTSRGRSFTTPRGGSFTTSSGGSSTASRFGSSTASRGSRSPYSTQNSSSTKSLEKTKPVTVHHSKPEPTPKVSNSKPTLTTSKAPAPPRKYEVAPRFLKLQAQKEAAKEHSSSNRVSPELSYPVRTSPVHFSPSRNSSHKSSYDFSLTRTVHSGPTSEDLDDDYGIPFPPPRPLLPKINVSKVDKLKQIELNGTAREYVELYAQIHNLSVDYDDRLMGQKKRNQGYITILRLGGTSGKTFRSYPELASTVEEAREIAATFAKEDIQSRKEHLATETPIRTEEEVMILLNRIEEIVCEKPTGMFTHGIIDEYENKFRESLPKGWIEKLKESSNLEVEQIDVKCGRVPNGINLIVRPARGFSSGSATPSDISANVYSEVPDFSNGDAIANLRFEDPIPEIPQLIVPAGNEWGVFITSTSNYITARLVDLDADFLKFSQAMSHFYDNHTLPISEVHEKQLYAAFSDPKEGKSLVQRVLANKVHDDWVECYIVDEGLFVEVKTSDLQELHNDFFQFPFQAIHLALDGLEDYELFMKPENLDFLLDKTFIAVVKRYRKPDEEIFPEGPGILRSIFSVILYDTSDNDADICLNDLIKQAVLESWECKLPKLGISTPGYLSHVTENGEIYLRFLHPETSLLEIELNKFSMAFEEACLENSFIPPGEICVAKFEDQRWYRAILPEEPSKIDDPLSIEVFFVDYGHMSVVRKSEICLLQPSKGYGSEALVNLGKQAVKCELYSAKPSPNSRWTLSATEKLLGLAPYDQELIVRVIEESPDSLSKVNLYKRVFSVTDSHIMSINEELANKPELFLNLSLTPHVSSMQLSKQNLPENTVEHLSGSYLSTNMLTPDAGDSVHSFQGATLTGQNNEEIEWLKTPDITSPDATENYLPLSPPQVPEKGQCFNVFVTIAASPHNFIVQPLQSAIAMDQLRTQMQQFYSSEENLFEMDQFMLKENHFYAALHSDGEWYRVRVVSISNNSEAAVYYVDFGDFNTVSIQNLQVLWNQFRTLPCQAIKASLAGIKPILQDWNPVHCVKFKEMVTEKNFVSIVQEKSLRDEQDFCCLELELTLIDTSDPKTDVYINDLLVKMSMARFT